MPKREGEPIACLVPFCRGRSWKWRHCEEYLCRKHYNMADASWRAAHRKWHKAIGETDNIEIITKNIERSWRVWCHLRDQVLSRAMSEEVADQAEPIIDRGRIRAPKHKPDF